MATLSEILQQQTKTFWPIVTAKKQDCAVLDFTANNIDLTAALLQDTDAFSKYVEYSITKANAKFGIGGYGEDRVLYRRSQLFDGSENNDRSIHLGVDIWGPALTPIHAPLGGIVHSIGNNNNFGDYGATIILQHQIHENIFYTLYGHLSLKSITGISTGRYIASGETFAEFGIAEENGFWPPHLHFQIIEDIKDYTGDYPGVASKADANYYLGNCPNANYMINLETLG
jgi:peptidoglycan LD-endopeptidase LytH